MHTCAKNGGEDDPYPRKPAKQSPSFDRPGKWDGDSAAAGAQEEGKDRSQTGDDA